MLSIRKDCEVEVSPEDEQFKEGSYFRAILEDSPMISGHKKLKVRYLTRFKEDSSALLTEIVNHNCIRPVPPGDLSEDVVFEKGSVVDAYIKDGWWTGVVVATMEGDKYLVDFNYPPETIMFEKNELRVHLDWINFKWVRFDRKELIKFVFSSGTMVEVRLEFSWLPAKIIKVLEYENKFIVEYPYKFLGCKENSNITTVDSVRVRPTQPSFSVEKYERLDRVEVFGGLAWCQGVVRAIVCEGRYMVSFEASNEASQFNHSDLRPSMEWENGVWQDRPMLNSGKGTTSNGQISKPKKRKKPSKSKRRNKPVALKTINALIDYVVNEKDSGSPITMETQEIICHEQMRNHNGLGNESTRDKTHEEHSQKSKRGELEHNSDINETSLSLDGTSNVVENAAANVEEIQSKDLVVVLPFAKKSPFWKTYESMEVFKRVPQSPHFNPLGETKEDFREGYAIGMMVTYSGLWERLKDLETNVPVSQLDSLKDSFAELEKHGFDVTLPLSRIEKLLALKDRKLQIVEELKVLDKEKMDEECKAKQELGEMEQKILEVKEQETALEKRKEAAKEQKDTDYKKICQMESDLGVKLEDVQFEFETTLSAPW